MFKCLCLGGTQTPIQAQYLSSEQTRFGLCVTRQGERLEIRTRMQIVSAQAEENICAKLPSRPYYQVQPSREDSAQGQVGQESSRCLGLIVFSILNWWKYICFVWTVSLKRLLCLIVTFGFTPDDKSIHVGQRRTFLMQHTGCYASHHMRLQ